MRLTVVFGTPAELVVAHDREMAHGGLLLRGQDPAGLTLFQSLPLAIECGGRRFGTTAQVVQMIPGVGVAVTFSVGTVPGLPALIDEARTMGGAPWPHARPPSTVPPPIAAAAPAPAAPAPAAAPRGTGPAPAMDPISRYRAMTTTEKIHLAMHGNRDDRAMVLRDPNRQLHPYVLKNPNLGLDEVVAMAKQSTISADVIKHIVDRREWLSRPDIAIALVRNPTVPVPMALRALEHVSPADLRQLAKDAKTRPAVQQAARKKVIAP